MNSKRIKLKRWVKVLLVFIILLSLTILYSRYIETKGIKVKEYPIVNKNIPDNFYGLKIVHLSDIHYKVTTDEDDLKIIIDKINKLKPDIVILSGDIFDSSIKYTDKDYKNITNFLNSIDYNIGKYAIKGEEDLKIEKWEEIIEKSDFINLNDTYEEIYSNGLEPILLVGISSNYKKNHIEDTLNNIYSNITREYKYSILILHEPDFIDYINSNKFNLILAGHSHNGQISLPFLENIISDKFSKKYYKEYYKKDNSDIYISSGIGTSKYKFRFLNKPSFNLYRLINK